MSELRKERGATNALITVLCMTLFLLVAVLLHYQMLNDNAELAQEELHNGTQIALSDAIWSNHTDTEQGRQYIIETFAGNGQAKASASAKQHTADVFNQAIKRNFDLGGDFRPQSGALHNMASDKRIQVLEFFVVERIGNTNTADSYRVYPYDCTDGKVGACHSSADQISSITGTSAKPYLKKITQKDNVFPVGSTIYARVAFANRTDNGLKQILLTRGSTMDTGKGSMIEFDNRTKDDAPVETKNAENYHVGASVTGTLPAVAVTEMMDITAFENDGRG